MPFVKAQCENCQGLLEVDPSKKAAICPYCGTPYVVQDAINNYHTHIDHLHADVVNVNDDKSAKARLEAAETFLKLGKYDSARRAFADVCELTPQNYHGWWGQTLAFTHSFSRKLTRQTEFEEVKSLFNDAVSTASDEDRERITEQFNNYYNPLYAQYNATLAPVRATVDFHTRQLADMDKTIQRTSVLPNKPKQAFSFPVFAVLAVIFIVGFISLPIGGPIPICLILIPILILIAAAFVDVSRQSNYDNKLLIRDRDLEILHKRREKIVQELHQAEARLRQLEVP